MLPHTSGLTPERAAEMEAVLLNTQHCIHKAMPTSYTVDMATSPCIVFSFYRYVQSATMIQQGGHSNPCHLLFTVITGPGDFPPLSTIVCIGRFRSFPLPPSCCSARSRRCISRGIYRSRLTTGGGVLGTRTCERASHREDKHRHIRRIRLSRCRCTVQSQARSPQRFPTTRVSVPLHWRG